MLNRISIIICLITILYIGTNIFAEDDHDHVEKDKTTKVTNNSDHDDHSGHEHEVANAEQEAGHTEDDGHDHSDSEDELTVELTPEAAKLAGITISTVQTGNINKIIELPGEVGFNEDNVAHIAPRFAGIALQAKFRVGDYVTKDDVVAVIESNESMNSYSIKAPISGWIIERHITKGEFVSEENSIYVIADLSTVWVNLAVYPKDADRVQKGQLARLKVIGSENITSGKIEYITPIVDFRTRSLTARVTLPNTDNKWRPGSFVQGLISLETSGEKLVIDKSAVQYLDEKSVVFVLDGENRFKPIEVVTGESDNQQVQVLSGISLGEKYVSNGAFELKAKIVTSNLDAHAGHGH